jgi:selenide,water dikinase
LDQALKTLSVRKDPNLLAGFEQGEDAGVYRVSDDLALIQTVDFFTPVVDDPYIFGQVAATNALSDVYAMGGKPLTCLNVVGFPVKQMEIEVLQRILEGGLSKIHEAGAVLVGGHSVDDEELKYGLSVTGLVHPDHVITNSGAKARDLLILTKPLGTGIIATALKGEMASADAVAKMTESMTALNKRPSEFMQKVGVNGCTDITGFGLLGHALEMARASEVGIAVRGREIPSFEEAMKYASMGLVPGGAGANRDFASCGVDVEDNLSPFLLDVLYDPQTSGGLLISVPAEKADRLLGMLHSDGWTEAAVIGEVVKGPEGRVIVMS